LPVDDASTHEAAASSGAPPSSAPDGGALSATFPWLADFRKDAATIGEPVGAPIPGPELEKIIARLAESATPEVVSEYRRLGQAK
jgi:hypothetical protein